MPTVHMVIKARGQAAKRRNMYPTAICGVVAPMRSQSNDWANGAYCLWSEVAENAVAHDTTWDPMDINCPVCIRGFDEAFRHELTIRSLNPDEEYP